MTIKLLSKDIQDNTNQFFIDCEKEKKLLNEKNQISLSNNKYNRSGYRIVKVNNRWVPKHRLVMEKYLGRKLEKGKIVHHIDHDIENNKIENLILCEDQSDHHFVDHVLSGTLNNLTPIKYKITNDRRLDWQFVYIHKKY